MTCTHIIFDNLGRLALRTVSSQFLYRTISIVSIRLWLFGRKTDDIIGRFNSWDNRPVPSNLWTKDETGRCQPWEIPLFLKLLSLAIRSSSRMKFLSDKLLSPVKPPLRIWLSLSLKSKSKSVMKLFSRRDWISSGIKLLSEAELLSKLWFYLSLINSWNKIGITIEFRWRGCWYCIESDIIIIINSRINKIFAIDW